MSKPSRDEIRRALEECLRATRRVDEVHDAEPVDEPAADAAIHVERLARDRLMELVARFVGPPPCILVIDGSIIAITDAADGMAVVPVDRVVKID